MPERTNSSVSTPPEPIGRTQGCLVRAIKLPGQVVGCLGLHSVNDVKHLGDQKFVVREDCVREALNRRAQTLHS